MVRPKGARRLRCLAPGERTWQPACHEHPNEAADNEGHRYGKCKQCKRGKRSSTLSRKPFNDAPHLKSDQHEDQAGEQELDEIPDCVELQSGTGCELCMLFPAQDETTNYRA
jgi:hypothetical protein